MSFRYSLRCKDHLQSPFNALIRCFHQSTNSSLQSLPGQSSRTRRRTPPPQPQTLDEEVPLYKRILKGKANTYSFSPKNFPQSVEYVKTYSELNSTTRRGNFYECIAADVLNSFHGFQDLTKVGRSGDQGIDIIGKLPSSLDRGSSVSVFGQCKCIKRPVGPGDLQSFLGAIQEQLNSETTTSNSGSEANWHDQNKPKKPPNIVGIFVSTKGLGTAASVSFRKTELPLMNIVFQSPLSSVASEAGIVGPTKSSFIDCNIRITANGAAQQVLNGLGLEIQTVYNEAEVFSRIATIPKAL